MSTPAAGAAATAEAAAAAPPPQRANPRIPRTTIAAIIPAAIPAANLILIPAPITPQLIPVHGSRQAHNAV